MGRAIIERALVAHRLPLFIQRGGSRITRAVTALCAVRPWWRPSAATAWFGGYFGLATVEADVDAEPGSSRGWRAHRVLIELAARSMRSRPPPARSGKRPSRLPARAGSLEARAAPLGPQAAPLGPRGKGCKYVDGLKYLERLTNYV